MAGNGHRRARPQRDIAGVILIPLVIATAIIAPAWVNMQQNQHTREVLCQNAYLNRVEVSALRAIADEMGLPVRFDLPALPETCKDFQPVKGLLYAGPKAPRDTCTETGTKDDDLRVTGDGEDVLCLLSGDDYGHANGGDDVVYGARGDDTLVGGHGRDTVRGGRDNDFLFGIDQRGSDRLHGGPGDDTCFIDRGDMTHGCEGVFVGPSGAFADAAMRMAYGALSIGMETQLNLESAPGCGHENPPSWCG